MLGKKSVRTQTGTLVFLKYTAACAKLSVIVERKAEVDAQAMVRYKSLKASDFS